MGESPSRRPSTATPKAFGAFIWAPTADMGRYIALMTLITAANGEFEAPLQSAFKHQTLAGNLPLPLRWNFHRLMLAQSMTLCQDDCARHAVAPASLCTSSRSCSSAAAVPA